ncbi:MAG: hypothetical protein ACK58N_18320 [Synechocystis sp.]
MTQFATDSLNLKALAQKNATKKTAWQVYWFKLGQIWPPLFLAWYFDPDWERFWLWENAGAFWPNRRLITLIAANGLLLMAGIGGGLTCGFMGCQVAKSPPFQTVNNTEDLQRLFAQATPKDQALIQRAQLAAAQAAQLAQKADGTQTNWLQREDFLQQAIAALLEIPSSSFLYPFAQDQKYVYQQQLTALATNIDQEQTGQNTLTEAIAIIERSKLTSQQAKTPRDLKIALDQWRGALTQLQQIPRQTSVYTIAQQRLKLSQTEWQTVKTNQTPLIQADYDYRSALKFAQIAETAMKQSQWETSVKAWQQAIASLEKIPANSNLAPQAQYLTPHYHNALQQGQQYLDRVAQQKQVQANLQKLCQSTAKPCQFTINNQGIVIKLSQGYLQDLWDAALESEMEDNPQKKAQLLNHLARLEESFQRLSNQGGLPLKVFHAPGN